MGSLLNDICKKKLSDHFEDNNYRHSQIHIKTGLNFNKRIIKDHENTFEKRPKPQWDNKLSWTFE